MKTSTNYRVEIFVLGNELLINFQNEIFKALEKQLMPRWGENWFKECFNLEKNIKPNYSKDLQVILKQLLVGNNGNFRLALASELFKDTKLSKSQLDSLAKIQNFRNLWAHPTEGSLTLIDLQNLGKEIIKFYGGNINQITEYCSFIISFKNNDDKPIPKILMNSALFKQHIGDIDSIYENIKNNPKLEAKVIDLQEEIARLKNSKSRDKDSPSDDFTFILHMLTDVMTTNTRLKLMISGLGSGLLTEYAFKSVKSKKLRKRKKDFEEQYLTELAEEFIGLTQTYEKLLESRSSTTGTNNCNCKFCTIVGESGTIGILSTAQMELFDLSMLIQKYYISEGKKTKL